jgi:hypothetical protein
MFMFANAPQFDCHPEASEGPCIQHWMLNGHCNLRSLCVEKESTRSFRGPSLPKAEALPKIIPLPPKHE